MWDRIRTVIVTVTSAPWRRAPLLLWRRPGVLATVAGACAVMAASLAAVPLFLSSVGSESVALQAAERCPRDTGATFSFAPTGRVVEAPIADPLVPLADRLGPSNLWMRVKGVSLAGADPSEAEAASLLVREGALEHVDVLEGTPGPGVWISDRATELTGLRVGDGARIGNVQLPVRGVYRDLSGNTVDDYWCSNSDMVLLEVRGADVVPPPLLVLVDDATLSTVMSGLDIDEAEGAWEAPLRDGLTTTDTEALVQDLACNTKMDPALRWCIGGRPLIPRVPGRPFSNPTEAKDDADFVERYLHSHLPFVTDRSGAIKTSVGGGIWPMAGLAGLAGVGLVAAAASLWFDRRRREVTLLTVRGVSPAALGLKAVLELCIPSVLGVLAGVGLAYGTVVWLGPSPDLEPTAIGRAVQAGGLALVGAAATIALVVAWRTRAPEARPHRRVRLGVLPWELLLGWATVVSYQRLSRWGIPLGRGADVSRVDVWGLLFPVLFLVTAVAVLSRLLSLALRPMRAASRSWPTALYLGVRRVARYRVAVLGLVAASAIAAGVLGYAATMNRSLDATLKAKAQTFVGSDVAVRLSDEEQLPPALVERSTEVEVFRFARARGATRDSVSVVTIDPATFDRAVLWDTTFSDTSLPDILERLVVPPVDGRVPAVVVGTEVDATAQVSVAGPGANRFDIEEVADVEAFPGMRLAKPTIFVATSAVDDLELYGGTPEAWIRGDRGDTLEALAAAGTAFSEERKVGEVADGASFLTVSWTFGFMQSLGISAGLLVLGGVAVYLDARRRDRLLGHAFMRRMGLSRRQHRRALVVELTASVLVGCWVGLGIAVVAASFAHQRVDPVPGYRPDPLLRPAVVVIATLVVASVVIAGLAAVLGQRRIDRDDPVEVLRAGV